MNWMMDAPPTLYHRKVSLVLRDAATQQVVYETSATYEDVWTRDPAIYEYTGAMRQATAEWASVTVHSGAAAVTPQQ